MHRSGYGTRSASRGHPRRRRCARIYRPWFGAGAGASRIGLGARLAGGAVFAAAVALLAWRARALTIGGAIAAWLVGTCVFTAGEWPYAAVLFAFFLPSS